MPNTEPLLTAREVARLYNVHIETVRRWNRGGLLAPAATLPSGRHRYRAEDVELLLRSKTQVSA